MRRVLITGGAGFVGSNLACFLKRDFPDWQVTSLDNLHRKGSELNVPRLQGAGVSFIRGDIRYVEHLDSAGDFDLLIECSAEPSVHAGYGESPDYLIGTNLVGTLNCLEKCRQRKADIVFLSTSRVYPMDVLNKLEFIEDGTRFRLGLEQKVGGISEHGISEDFPLNGIRSLYGGTKLCSEIMIQEYIAAYDIKGIINRCGVLSGPWQMGKVDQGFVSLWIGRHLWAGKLSYIGYGGKGKQVRDILHIEDLYSLLKIQIGRIDDFSGRTFNVGGGNKLSISLCELTALCREVTGNEISISSVLETRQADIPYYVTDCRHVQELTGWVPGKTVEDIVVDILAWLRSHEGMLRPIFNE